MRTSELKELIREIVLNELDMDKTVQRKIDEFGQFPTRECDGFSFQWISTHRFENGRK